jgi:putative ABC transport system permease protein
MKYWQEMRQAGRRVWRRKLTFVVLAALLACGVSATTALFSVIDGVLFKPLPYRDSGQLIAIGAKQANLVRPGPLAWRDLRRLEGRGLAKTAYYARVVNPTYLDQPISGTPLTAVSGDFFGLLGGVPHRGRLLGPADVGGLQPKLLVLAYAEWMRGFGGDDSVVDRVVDFQGERFLVVGVAQKDFEFPGAAGGWTPVTPPGGDLESQFGQFEAIGRLPHGLTLEAAAARAPDLALLDLREYLTPGNAFGLVALFLASLLVLGVAWVQIAALQLARADEAAHEVRVRVALGASRRKLIEHRLAEGVWLAGAALAMAIALVPGATQFIAANLPWQITRGLPIHTDVRVVLCAVLLSALGVVGLYVAPVWTAHLGGGLALLRGAHGVGAGRRARQILVIVQVAVTVPLLYVAGLTVRSYSELRSVNVGFSTEDVVAVRLPKSERGDSREKIVNQRRALLDAARAAPGVLRVSAADALPFGGVTRGTVAQGHVESAKRTSVTQLIIDSEYFAVLGIAVSAGRTFGPEDARGGALVAVLNHAAASAMATDVGASEGRLYVNGLPVRVIGVVDDVRDIHPGIAAEPRVYLPSTQWIPETFLIARFAPGDRAQAGVLRARLAGMWPTAAEWPNLIWIEDRLIDKLADVRGRANLLSVCALMAVAMTCIGVWGSVSAATQQRTAENAIRLVCGANPVQLGVRELRGALHTVLSGAAIGLAVATAGSRLLASLFYGVHAVDGLTVVWVVLGMVGVALGAASLPALRVCRLDPVRSLRED